MISINLNDIAISNIYGADYRCLITGISKSGAIDLFKNVDLSEKKWKIVRHQYFYNIHKGIKKILRFVDIGILKMLISPL